MTQLPTGVVTFMLSDVQDSSTLWETDREAMRAAVARLDAIVSAVVSDNGGVLVKPRGEGDSHFAVFALATDGVRSSGILQRQLLDARWPSGLDLRVRIALHSGEADLRDGDYYGLAVNRCGRLRLLAHGGQILVSRATAELVFDGLTDGLSLRNLGTHTLRGLSREEEVWQLCGTGLPDDFPALASPGSATRGAVTILISDVVGSTQMAAEMGNRRYREWVDRHEKVVRHEIERFSGRLWSVLDAGVTASFDGANAAVECARAISDGVSGLGARVRIGLHAGDVEVHGNQPRGLALNIAARVCQLAEPGDVLVTRTISDLLVGSDIGLEDRGEVTLRGVPGQWRIYALEPAAHAPPDGG